MPLSNEVLTALAIERIEEVGNDRKTAVAIKLANMREIQRLVNNWVAKLEAGDYHDWRA